MILNLPPLQNDEEEVSYDVVSLFTSVAVKETVDDICDEIYVHKKLPPICNRNIFKKLLYKVITWCIFSANNKVYKQRDGVSMGESLSVTFSGIFMNKMERDIVKLLKPIFYKRYLDDTYQRKKKSAHVELFQSLNFYLENIKFTVESSPTRFLDSNIKKNLDGTFDFKVVNKETKIPFHWSSQVPKQYKRNVIKGDLSRAKRISSNFDSELTHIRSKYSLAGYPKKFIEA